MREIEFRAKSKFNKNKKWVYGDLIQGENVYISTKEDFYSAVVSLGGHLSTFVELVDKETLGQYTGLTDKNGTKIFEGDLVYYRDANHDEEDGAMEVIFEDGAFMISGDILVPLHELYNWELEVIGNVYDNGDFINEN